MSVGGKCAVVTGSNSGIGLGVAEELARLGANVVLNSFTDSPEDHALARGSPTSIRAASSTSRPTCPTATQCRRAGRTAAEALGRVDILVNNAGIQHVAPVPEFPAAKWDQILAINLSSAFHTTAAALPLMRAQGWGRIVNIASAHGLTASPFKSAYVAAKHGVVGLTKVVALETAEEPITCNAICPGYVLTPLVEAQIPDTMKQYGMDRETVIREVLLDRQPSRAVRHRRADRRLRRLPLLARRRAGHRHHPLGRRRLDRAVTAGKTSSTSRSRAAARTAPSPGASLDRLLEEDDIEIEGISATSAGAMNAAALKHGWVLGGNAGAREWLDTFWLRVSGLDGVFGEAMMDWLRAVSPSPAVTARILEASPAVLAAEAVTRVFSPYQFNPANYHPLRGIVEEMLETDAVCSAKGPKLFINATNVRDGKPRIFQGDEITADAILASACLPTLYQAIEIDDPKTGRREAYWDGGYTGNPALYPLFYRTRTPDILIVHINPLYREELPKTVVGNREPASTRSASTLRCCASSATSSSSTACSTAA